MIIETIINSADITIRLLISFATVLFIVAIFFSPFLLVRVFQRIKYERSSEYLLLQQETDLLHRQKGNILKLVFQAIAEGRREVWITEDEIRALNQMDLYLKVVAGGSFVGYVKGVRIMVQGR